MKKIASVLLIFITTLIKLFCTETDIPLTYYGSNLTSIDFKTDNIAILEDDISPYSHQLRYECKVENSLPFLYFADYEKTLFLFNKYIAIASPLSTSYESSDDEPYVLLFSKEFPSSTRILKTSFGNFNTITKSSSFLVEGEIEYNAEKLLSPLGGPWATENNGINEYIELLWSDDEIYKNGVDFIAICSGYISYEKPYLYEYNSRPKRIEIHDLDNNTVKEFFLEDTPNPQFLFLEESTQNIKIKILEAYEGTKWSDLCIDYILGFTNEMLYSNISNDH